MAAFSDYLEEKIVEATLRGGTFPTITSTYVALFTSDPGETGATGEVSAAGSWSNYQRVDAADGGIVSTGWSNASDGSTSNAKVITFPANNGATPVTVTHIGIFDALAGGSMLFHAQLGASKTLNTGDVLSFNVGSLQITVD